MCLACEEEAFYRAYLEHLAKKAAQEGAPVGSDPAPVCEEADERARRETNNKQ